MQVFDPNQDYQVLERRLPHWTQAGTICFITWRTWDSIPETVLIAWIDERNAWLRQHGINPVSPNWRNELLKRDAKLIQEYRLQISERWNDHLDACHGACVLRRPELSQILAKSLQHFDGTRYDLTDFVVMPNHVHLLVAFADEDSMLKQCESWKHFTATQINRALGRSGRFWQQDGFDHLVRSWEQFTYLRRYVAENPLRSKLGENQYVHFSKSMYPSRSA